MCVAIRKKMVHNRLMNSEVSPDPSPGTEAVEAAPASRSRAFPPVMILAAVFTGLASTALWVLATWGVGLPLVFMPLAMGVAVGAVTGALSPRPDLPQALFAGGVALILGVGGNIASTLLLATPPGALSSYRHTWKYLQSPERLQRVLARTFTPMDVLIYAFVAGAAAGMVLRAARRRAAMDLPEGEPVEARPVPDAE